MGPSPPDEAITALRQRLGASELHASLKYSERTVSQLGAQHGTPADFRAAPDAISGSSVPSLVDKISQALLRRAQPHFHMSHASDRVVGPGPSVTPVPSGAAPSPSQDSVFQLQPQLPANAQESKDIGSQTMATKTANLFLQAFSPLMTVPSVPDQPYVSEQQANRQQRIFRGVPSTDTMLPAGADGQRAPKLQVQHSTVALAPTDAYESQNQSNALNQPPGPTTAAPPTLPSVRTGRPTRSPSPTAALRSRVGRVSKSQDCEATAATATATHAQIRHRQAGNSQIPSAPFLPSRASRSHRRTSAHATSQSPPTHLHRSPAPSPPLQPRWALTYGSIPSSTTYHAPQPTSNATPLSTPTSSQHSTSSGPTSECSIEPGSPRKGFSSTTAPLTARGARTPVERTTPRSVAASSKPTRTPTSTSGALPQHHWSLSEGIEALAGQLTASAAAKRTPRRISTSRLIGVNSTPIGIGAPRGEQPVRPLWGVGMAPPKPRRPGVQSARPALSAERRESVEADAGGMHSARAASARFDAPSLLAASRSDNRSVGHAHRHSIGSSGSFSLPAEPQGPSSSDELRASRDAWYARNFAEWERPESRSTAALGVASEGTFLTKYATAEASRSRPLSASGWPQPGKRTGGPEPAAAPVEQHQRSFQHHAEWVPPELEDGNPVTPSRRGYAEIVNRFEVATIMEASSPPQDAWGARRPSGARGSKSVSGNPAQALMESMSPESSSKSQQYHPETSAHLPQPRFLLEL
jgi:hypothetical protein